jgi:hypothetical protein
MKRLTNTAIAAALFALHLASSAAMAAAQPPRTFASAQEASNALYLAVQGNDDKALTAILGAGKELVSSHDSAQDRLDRKRFITKYREMHRLVREPDTGTILYIGAENWPFPVPLASENGAWHFDATAGMDEVLFRRIGENELNAAQACHALVLAQKEHRWPERDAAMRALRTLPGHGVSHGAGVAFHGYYFRTIMDTAPGNGYAVVAYPATYGSTGMLTYVVGLDDVVYGKDLGPDTGSLAKGMSRYERDSTWHPEE